MKPWILLGKAQTPGDGSEIRLYQRDSEFSIKAGKAGNIELMNSRVHGSEDALAQLACEKIAGHTQPRVLIGGLGMGFTLRSALNELGATAQVAVAELVPAVVGWNRGSLAALANHPLEDSRVTLHETDVAQMIRTAKDDYSAILLDVDNGPQSLTLKDNHWLYGLDGLKASFDALRPNGVLGVWSPNRDSAFAKRLGLAGFIVDEIGVRARGKGKGGEHHIVWIATRP